MTDKTCFAISNTDGLYFAGFDVNGDAAWDSVSQACTYTDRLHAETQALLLVQDDDSVCRKADELPSGRQA